MRIKLRPEANKDHRNFSTQPLLILKYYFTTEELMSVAPSRNNTIPYNAQAEWNEKVGFIEDHFRSGHMNKEALSVGYLDLIGNLPQGKRDIAPLLATLSSKGYTITSISLMNAHDDALKAFRGSKVTTVALYGKYEDPGYYHEISDTCLRGLKNQPIKSLFLIDCSEITDVGLAVIKQLPCLTSLEIYNCEKITQKGLEIIKERPLKSFILNGREQIPQKSAVKKAVPLLQSKL